MTKKQFITSMKKLIALSKDEQLLNKAFKRISPDFNYLSLSRHEALIIELLEIAMNDRYEYIAYWFYELEQGKEAKKGTITDFDNKDIPIKTLSDLYNIIKSKNEA